MFGWFKKRRRKKILAQAWPEAWNLHLNRNVRLTWELNPDELQRLQTRTKIFVAEKRWEGCEGLEITEEMKVTVAAQACLMLLGVKDFYFDNVKTILMFPQAFERKRRDGLVSRNVSMLGEAWQGGPIILSWKDTLKGGRNEDDGRNLVLHEFAHALDGLDGEMGGEVKFDDPNAAAQWKATVAREFEALCNAAEGGRRTLIDHYGATNHAEFFACAVESFFEEPDEMHREHSELFSLLKAYFRVDPCDWQRKRPSKRRRR